jgi:hypothetical protein
MIFDDTTPRRAGTREERGECLCHAFSMLARGIATRDVRVRAAVLWGLKNDRCDPIWKQLRKVVAKTPIDWEELTRVAMPLIRIR